MAAALEVAVRPLFASANGNIRSTTGRRRCISMARLMAPKSTRLPTLIEPSVMPRPVSNNGSSPVSEGVGLAPIRLTCPPTAKALSDIAIVPGPPISTTQSTAAADELARFLIPIRRLDVVDHARGSQRLEPLSLVRGGSRRDHPGAQHPGEFQGEHLFSGKWRNAPYR